MDDAQGYLRERAADIRSNGHTLTAEMHENIADYISRLEAVVRAADAIAHDLGVLLGSDYSPEEYAYDEARARVTLPPLTQTNQAKDGDKEDASNGK